MPQMTQRSWRWPATAPYRLTSLLYRTRIPRTYIAEMRTLTSHDLSIRLGMEILRYSPRPATDPVFEGEWSDINLNHEVFTPKNKSLPPLRYPCWVVPKHKTKTQEEDIVIPLSEQALKILHEALTLRKRHPRYIFPTGSWERKQPFSYEAFTR